MTIKKDEIVQIEKELHQIKLKQLPNTFFNIIGRNKDEILISKMLAFLLNPKNTTICLLQDILAFLGKSELVENVVLEEFSDDEIAEVVVGNGRIDLFFKFEKLWIVIENKIDAHENNCQTLVYQEATENLKDNKMDVVYIYLKPKYNTSKPSNDNFQTMLYDDLVDIMKNTSIYSFENKDNYKFMEEFIAHTEGYIMGDKKLEFGDEIEFYIENLDKLNVIKENYEKQCEIVKENLENLVKETFENKFKIHTANGFIQIFLPTWLNDAHNGIHFEIKYPPKAVITKNTELQLLLHVEKNAACYKTALKDIVNNVNFIDEYDFSTSKNVLCNTQIFVNKCEQIILKNLIEIEEILNTIKS